MVGSPFAFLRGSAVVMAADLVGSPTTGISVQACGDAHLVNFGVFGTQERNLVFGMNDFDETLPGPWEWDIKRLAASVIVANRHLGFPERTGLEAAHAALRSYRQRMAEFARMGNLELWYQHISEAAVLAVLTPDVRARAETLMAKARGRTNVQVLQKTTELIDGNFRIVESPPLIIRPHATGPQRIEDLLAEWLNGYRSSLANDRRALIDRYRIVDAVRKVVGVGSVGTRCFVVLLRGESDEDPLFLQIKEAQASVLERHFDRSRHVNHGRRVVEGQRLIQPAADIFLGWGTTTNLQGKRLDYYVRQLRDMKGGIDLVPGLVRPAGFTEYSALCGWALALAHARSGDASMIAGYLGSGTLFDDALVKFAVAYADVNEQDHARLVAAVKSGRIAAEENV